MINRRSLLIGTGAGLVVLAAPAIVRASSLMPVKAIPRLGHFTVFHEFVVGPSSPLGTSDQTITVGRAVPWDVFDNLGIQGSAAWELRRKAEKMIRETGIEELQIHLHRARRHRTPEELRALPAMKRYGSIFENFDRYA